MKIQSLVLSVWTLLELFVLSHTAHFDDFGPFPDESSVDYTYTRFPEIEMHCSPFLSSASDLEPNDSRGYRLENELSFFNGDWEQETGGTSLMPFDDTDVIWEDQVHNIEPNWKFSDKNEYPNRLGPFLLGKEINDIGWRYDIVKLIIQNVICEPETNDNKSESTRVSTLLRAFPASMDRDTAADFLGRQCPSKEQGIPP
ncbi:hypothetical protein Acr_11g0005970 [Actinidia rufa]|uniref:Uncharacterized protein n=1 Tax=Actinidia rufa TaxID=165716 RepID=A0A7J0FC84_9ERIC|nr:hypothetical protein Acr_11g0005970 [Actinidia rufa]